MRTDVTKINEKTPHQDLTEGLMVFAGGTSKLFNTGEWRTNTPIYVADKCKQCLLCTPVCRTAVFRLKMESVANLTMTIVRAAAFVLKYAHLAQLR